MLPDSLLLLGPTGTGKTPLGEYLERTSLWNRRCRHFDFGANLRSIVEGIGAEAFSIDEIQYLRKVLKEGALLEKETFHLALRILDEFIAAKGIQTEDLIILNGLPRHIQQAQSLEEKLKVIGVVLLEADAATVLERLRQNTGGDRLYRVDDQEALVVRKLEIYAERTRPLVEFYQARDVPVYRITVNASTYPSEVVDMLKKIHMDTE
jgi:adenylate kinase